MSTYLYDSCREQPLATKQADQINNSLNELRSKVRETPGVVESILGPSDAAIDTLLAASKLKKLVHESRVTSGVVSNGSYSFTNSLLKSGFCSTSAQLSNLTSIMNGQNPVSDFKSESPTVVADVSDEKSPVARSAVARIDFPLGITNAETHTESLQNRLRATLGVMQDSRASIKNRSQAVVDFMTTADMAIASGIEEIVDSQLLKNNRARDTKIVNWVENSVEGLRELQTQMQVAAMRSPVINVDKFIAAIGEFKATCAALAGAK